MQSPMHTAAVTISFEGYIILIVNNNWLADDKKSVLYYQI